MKSPWYGKLFQRAADKDLLAYRQRAEAGDAEAADGRFGAAGDHDIGILEGNKPGSVADGVGARGTGGHHRMVGPLAAELDRNEARGKIDERAGNEKRADPARPLLGQDQGGLLDVGEAADARADQHAGATAIFLGLEFKPGVGHRLLGGGNRIDEKVVVTPDFLGVHPLFRIESAVASVAPLDLAGDAAGKVGGLEPRDWPGARAAIQE